MNKPSSWRIKPLPQRNRPAFYGVLLIAENGEETQIGMSSKGEQGIRSQMSKHPDYRGLPEDRPFIGTPVERLPPATIGSGPYTVHMDFPAYEDAIWPMPMPDLITQEGGEW